MKKSFFLFSMLLCACAMLMTGCKKDQDQRFKLVIADQPQHKTSLGDGYTTNWQVGDQVYINGTTANDILTIGTAGNQYTWASTEGLSITPINGNYYAFYAGERVSNVSASIDATEQKFNFTMPSTYTYNPDNLHSPMAAMAADNRGTVVLNFYNLCSLLELEVPKASANVSYTITITDVNQATPLSGDFTSSYNGSAWVTTAAVGNTNNYQLTITHNTPETKIYIPIPAGPHKLNIRINDVFKALQQGENYTFNPGCYYPISTVPATPETDIAGDLLPYPISDGSNSYYFGKGNMTYNHDANPQWRLESNQWDYTLYGITGTDANGPTGVSGSLALMVNTTANPAALNNRISGTMSEAGYATLLGEDASLVNNWKVPSEAQWTSILGSLSTPSTAKWAYVRINDNNRLINGMIIFPNRTDCPSTIALGQTYTVSGNNQTVVWPNTVPEISAADFEALETRGAIFLPAAGWADHSGKNGTWNDDGKGHYRTFAANSGGNKSTVMIFDYANFPSFDQNAQNGAGYSVRLMRTTTTTTSSSK